MSFLTKIGSFFSPLTDLVKTLDISGNEKAKILNLIQKTSNDISEKGMELLKLDSISTEWLAKNWRPLCMILLVLTTIYGDVAKVDLHTVPVLTESFLKLYGVSRGLEKITDIIRKRNS